MNLFSWFQQRARTGGVFSPAINNTGSGSVHVHYNRSDEGRASGPIFYNLPSLPPQYQARAEDLAATRNKLLTGAAPVGISSAARPFGLHGMGGIGKTVLATALVHDPALREAYPDGVAWLTFGRGASVLSKAAELAFALSRSEASFTSVDEACGRLSLLTQGKRLLIVLDDVWESGAVDAFARLGPGCRLLITTRDNGVLVRAAADRHELDLLSPPAAKKFLATAAGLPIGNLPGEAEDLIKECGGLPLALASVGALIRSDTYTWSNALAALQEAALEEFEDRHERTLAAVLKLSVDALSDSARAAFLDCAAFREGAAVPEATLLRIWSDRSSERAAKRLTQDLVERCLIARDDQAAADRRPQYRIHDLYMAYLHQAAAPLPARHRHIIERYGAVCFNGWNSGPNDGYFFQHLPWHLREAGRIEELRSLLFGARWLQQKLSSVSVLSLIVDYQLLKGDPEAMRLGSALGLSVHVLRDHPEQLKTQLCGRLAPEDGPGIAALLETLGQECSGVFDPARYGYLRRPGALLRTIPTGSLVTAVAVLPDGKRALSGAEDNTLRLWDLDTGTETRCFDGHDKSVRTVALLSDGKRALSGAEDHTLRLWDLDTGAELCRFVGHVKAVTSTALLPDGKRALSGSEDSTLRLWDLNTGTELRCFHGHDNAVRAVAILPGGKLALSGSNDKTLRLWDLDTGVELRRFQGHENAVTAVALIPHGKRALSGSWDRTLRLWDLDNGAELRRFDGHYNGVRTVAPQPDGKRALSGSWDNTLRLWDLDTGAELRRFDGHDNAITSVALLPDAKRALSGSEDSSLRLWDLNIDTELRRADGHDNAVTAVALLPDEKQILSSSTDKTLRLWDLDTGTELHRFHGHHRSVAGLALLPDGKSALSGSSDKTMRLWDLSSGAELRRIDGRDLRFTVIALLPDGRRALSGSTDRKLRLWDLHTGAELRRFEGHDKSVRAIALLPDGKRALSGSDDNTLRLWDLSSGAELRRFVGHDNAVTSVTLLPDGDRALSGSEDNTLRLWDLGSGAELHRFLGHENAVRAVAVPSHGKRALSGSNDKTLRLWDLNTGTELGSFASEGSVTAIAVSRGGNRIVIGDSTGRIIPLDIRS